MSAPKGAISATHRSMLKDNFKIERSQTVTPGRLMWCQGRRILGYGNIDDLTNVFGIPRGTNTITIAAADYDDVKGWLA